MEFEMYAYKRYASVVRYVGKDRMVAIPHQYKGLPVTEIREDAFARNSQLEAVFMPPTVRSVGANAFVDCTNLRYVGIGPKSLELAHICSLPEIERPDLEDIDPEELPGLSLVPEQLQVVEAGAFARTGIRGMDFRSPTVTLGASAFEGCKKLEKVLLFGCEDLTLGKRVFADSSVARVYAPKARIDIMPEYAFANCRNLVSVMARVDAVDTRAFYRCEKLQRLYVVKQLQSVGREAFEGCTQLEDIPKPARRQTPKIQVEPEQEEKTEKPDFSQILKSVQKEMDALKKKEQEEEDQIFQKEFGMIEPNRTDTPLFYMTIDHRGKKPREIPDRVKGNWRQGDDNFGFEIYTPTALCEVGMGVLMNQSLKQFTPLMNFCVKKKLTVVLLGKQEGELYAVYDIHPVTGGKEASPELFREMIRRLKQPVAQETGKEDNPFDFSMRMETEFESMLQVCKNRIPAWVCSAYHKNQETIRNRGSRMAEEECKHARRAQELLMNIDWMPQVVNVPPAQQVRKILDEEFFGLEEVKERIMEVVAQIRRSHKLPKWGILLNGPAGTGKTSITKAIARILGLPLIQLDLSSTGEDPDGISGSNRVFANARPGMLLESMFRVRSSTAVLLTNEVDKAGEGKSGRSASDILLSILDKTGFYEKFLEEIVPTDNLFCIGTCNDLGKLSKPLRDRFLVIDIAGYTADEKKVIFQDYVFPKAMANAGILPEQMGLDDGAVELLTSQYALEPGARDLEQYAERFVGDYCLHADEQTESSYRKIYTEQDLKELFGPPRTITRRYAIRPGQVNAAFYYNGKAHFYMIEAAIAPGSGKFEVLGPVAQLQQEYCKVAYWCARNSVSKNACDFAKCDVTVFVPRPIPDGLDNHVGIACYAAICSKLMNTNLALNDICFAGGCDMNGSLYFDENDLTPLLQAMQARGISTLYAPMGTTGLVNPKASSGCSVTIVEAPDAQTLFSLAVTQSNCKC